MSHEALPVTAFVGDARGNVTVEFTVEALANFIETWNRAQPYDAGGNHVIKLEAEEYEPGKARLKATLEALPF